MKFVLRMTHNNLDIQRMDALPINDQVQVNLWNPTGYMKSASDCPFSQESNIAANFPIPKMPLGPQRNVFRNLFRTSLIVLKPPWEANRETQERSQNDQAAQDDPVIRRLRVMVSFDSRESLKCAQLDSTTRMRLMVSLRMSHKHGYSPRTWAWCTSSAERSSYMWYLWSLSVNRLISELPLPCGLQLSQCTTEASA